jgi:hypothetical protein
LEIQILNLMQISEEKGASGAVGSIQDGYAFTHLGDE